MKRTIRLLATTALCAGLAAPALAETILVTTFDATGDGSLQAALDGAAASPEATRIVIATDGGRIETVEGLLYDGTSPLAISGNGVTVASARNVTLLTILAAPEVVLEDMTFAGPGGWSIENRAEGPAGKGIFLDVADDATGTVVLRIRDITVTGVAGHGIHVSDCTLADACGGGGGGAGEGSAASVRVEMVGVLIDGVGQGRFDADGLRVDERGPGSIDVTGMNVVATGVGADGIELDEGQEGDVTVDLIYADFIENGDYCDPTLLTSFLPDVPEDDFDEGTTATTDIPGPVTGSPDDACIERDVDLHDDGSVEEYEFAIDVDDGLDIDEAGPGSIIATFSVGQMLNNFDEGYDFDEEGPGDIDVVFTGIVANGNIDDAIKLTEEGGGDVYITATAVEASSNGGVGIVAEEAGLGDLFMALISTATSGNDGGELGVEAVQEDDGEGHVHVIDTEIADGIETDGAAIDAD